MSKWRDSMIKKYGSEEAYKAFMRSLASKGGKAPHKTPRGFAANPETASEMGAIGGAKSKRTKKEK